MMGTRCGDLDVGAVTFLMDKEMLGTAAASSLFNKQSGMLGVTGISSDMREIENAAENGDTMAILGNAMYAYRVKKYIGSYAAVLGGVDILIFTGGIGENDMGIRAAVCEGLEFLGLQFDKDKNNGLRGKEAIISKENSKLKVLIVPTNEELVIAQDTMKIVEEIKQIKIIT